MSGTDPTSEDAVPEAFDRWRPPARYLIPCYGSLRKTSRWRILIRSFLMGMMGVVIIMLLSRLALLMILVGSLPKPAGPATFMLLPLVPLVSLGVCLLLGVVWLIWREHRLIGTPDVQYVLREEAVEKICPHCRLDPFIHEGCCRDFPRGWRRADLFAFWHDVASATSIPPTEGARRLHRLDDEERRRLIHAWYRERGPAQASMACPTGGWIQWVCNRARIVLDLVFPILILYFAASAMLTLPEELIPDLKLPVGVSESLLTLSIFAVFLVAGFMFFPRWRHTFLLAFKQLRSASDANHPACRGCGHILHQLKPDRCTECGHELNTWDSVMFHPGLDGLIDPAPDDPNRNSDSQKSNNPS